MLLAAILFNALTGLLWGGLGLAVAAAAGTRNLTIVFFPLLMLSRFWTAWLLYKRDPRGYGRSMRTNLIGAALALFLVLSRQSILGVLIPLELLAALFTYAARDQLPNGG